MTNKPEVVAWRWRKPIVNDQGEAIGATAWESSAEPRFLPWWTNEPLIRLSDYEALQAEYDRLIRYCKNGLECFANPCERHSGERTPPLSEFFERYGGQCLICVVDNNKTLQAECEMLRCIINDLKDWDCDVRGGFLSIPLYLRRRMQEAIDAARQEPGHDSDGMVE